MRRIDLFDTITLELGNSVRNDHAPTAAKYLDAFAAARTQQVDEIAQVFVMAALITGHGDAVGVFVQRGSGHFIDGAVVAEVDHLDAARLQHAPHDVDRPILPVSQGITAYET